MKTGDIYKHQLTKTITESDNNLFCLLTMNHHPLHSDIEYAKRTQFGQRVVVGTLVISLVVGMSVQDISYNAIANLGYTSINHHKPVFINDTIHAQTEILEIKDSPSSNKIITHVETRAFNQHDILVLTLRRHILVPK